MESEMSHPGPIDYLLVEWVGKQPEGEIAPHLVDLVDRGLIRILDLVFLAKGEDGSIEALEIADLGGEVAELAIFEGASSGLLSEEDHEQAGAALEPGTSAALPQKQPTQIGNERSPPSNSTQTPAPTAGRTAKPTSSNGASMGRR